METGAQCKRTSEIKGIYSLGKRIDGALDEDKTSMTVSMRMGYEAFAFSIDETVLSY